MEDIPQWKTIFDLKRPLMEDNLSWKITIDGRGSFAEDDLKCNMTMMKNSLQQKIFQECALPYLHDFFSKVKGICTYRLSLFLKMLKHYDIVGEMCAFLTYQSFKTKQNIIPTKISFEALADTGDQVQEVIWKKENIPFQRVDL